MHTEASIRTYTGRHVDILNPVAKDICITDMSAGTGMKSP
jgi:hypothetical protein